MGLSRGASALGLEALYRHMENSLCLSKVPLSFFIAFSALFGYCLAPSVSMGLAAGVFTAVFLLSCGVATLNNIQDRDIDGLSERTCNRPFPRGRVTVRYALIQSLVLVTGATVLLACLSTSPFPAILGLLALALYNGGYTPLKRRTLWAMVPGTLCGMLPPLIGWTASGGPGRVSDILTAMVIMGLWQIPHTWLVHVRYVPGESESVPPSFTGRINPASLNGILYVWVLAFAVLTVMFAGDVFVWRPARWLAAGNAAVLGLVFCFGLSMKRRPCYGRLFAHLNLALSVVMGLAVCDGVMVPA